MTNLFKQKQRKQVVVKLTSKHHFHQTELQSVHKLFLYDFLGPTTHYSKFYLGVGIAGA
jgi:hypothetical protein